MENHTRRIVTVLCAPAAALGAWGIARAIGIDLTVSTSGGTMVGAADVVVAATLAALVAWLVVRQLEHRVVHPRLWWARIGATALSVSIVGPAYLADGASSAALICLHVVTAFVVIHGFAGTLPKRAVRPSGAGETSLPSAR